MFRHYCVILRELVVSTLPGYTSMYIPGQHDGSINIQIVYTANTDGLHENYNKKMIFSPFYYKYDNFNILKLYILRFQQHKTYVKIS